MPCSHRRGLLERNFVGQLHNTVGINQPDFGVTADRSRVCNAIAYRHAGHALADGFDGSCAFRPGRER
jgi:hypothetical protein